MILNIDKFPTGTQAAIDSSGKDLRYGDIIALSEYLSGLLPSRSLVFILTRNNVGGIAWSIGMINVRIVPLLLNARIEASLFDQLFKLYAPQYICIPEEDLYKYNFTEVTRQYGYALLSTGNPSYPMFEELSHLLPTSGSTGSPKLVRHSYANIEAAALNISTFFKITPTERPLMVLPLYYTMGLSMVFSHLYTGACILITELSMTDKSFWNFIKEEHATSFTGVPYSFEILNLMRFFKMDLPELKLLTQGGGKMPKSLNIKFAEYCRDNGKQWIATYGQSEGTARMAYLPPKYALSKCGSIGKAVPNGELSLIDEYGNVIIEPYKEGEMCYRGKNVTLGYALGKKDLLLGDKRNGFLRTGDLAYRDEDGFYYIVGRKGRFLKLYGSRVGLDECEQIIKSKFPMECACVGTDEKMVVYITDDRLTQQIKEELVDKTKIVASAFEIRIIPEIPKNGAGKILYKNLNVI